ncbi:transcription elongation factor GreA [Paenibacillus periandrae]|uniref:transcription elongation factor GreA n=1 Tax=Paenibacillus periandrae TaxID=1761741 RepID=UPI001F08B806|nr:transcription elongation factor GreA [Paenibacillus periandrae]
MSTKEVVLTKEGILKLEGELEYLKSVKRREVSDRIKSALENGGVDENSEYEDAKNEQAFVEGRIISFEKMLKNVKVADVENGDTSAVSVGLTVLLKDLEYNDTVKYTIVGPIESDVFNNKISYESPLGKALMGKSTGTKIDVTAPAGVLRYEILEILNP